MRSHPGPAFAWRSFHPAVLLYGILLSITCLSNGAAASPPRDAAKAEQTSTRSQTVTTPQAATHPTADNSPEEEALPLTFERHTDDLDAMVKRGNIRALVVYNEIRILLR